MTKIGVNSSKNPGGANEAKRHSKKHHSAGGQGGGGLRLVRRTARVAPARTVLVAAVVNSDPVFAEGKKELASSDPARGGRMASNGNDDQQAVEMDAELSPGNNSKLWYMILSRLHM